MERIGNVFVIQRRFCSLIDVLRSIGRSDQNKILRMFPDDRNDRIGILAHLFPGRVSVWFIADLENHIGNLSIFLCHFFEKGFCLRKMVQRILIRENMPVDHAIHVEFPAKLYALIDLLFQLFLVSVRTVSA